jgi:hypothetical protein
MVILPRRSAGAPHPAVAAHGAGCGAPGAPRLILPRSRLFDGNAVTFCLTNGITVANLTGVGGGRGEREYQKNNSSNQFHIFSPVKTTQRSKTGDVWPEADRKLWLQLLEGSFKLIYKDAPEEPRSSQEEPFRKSKYAE